MIAPVEDSGKNEWGLYGMGGNLWELAVSKTGDPVVKGATWVHGHADMLRVDADMKRGMGPGGITLRVVLAPANKEAFMADVQNKPSDLEKHQALPQVEIPKALVPSPPPPQERGNRETPHIRELRLTPTSEILHTYTNCNAAFCAIFPALDKQDTAYAVECFEILRERDTFLAQLVLEWSTFLGPKDSMWLHAYYTSKRQKDKVRELVNLYFPKGMRKVHLADLSSPPTSGVSFAGESSTMRQFGIRGDMVICAVDGYQVDTMLQYCYVRDLDPSNLILDLILWNGTNYQNITNEIANRRFGIGIQDYKP